MAGCWRPDLTIGREVRAGEVLVALDAEAERLAIEEQRARLGALAARRESLRKEIRAEQETLVAQEKARAEARAEAKALVLEAEARMRAAEFQAQASARLRKSNAVSEETLRKDEAEAEARRAQARALVLATTRGEQDRLVQESDRRTRLAGLEREQTEIEGEMAITEATIRGLEHEVERHRIRAPVSGRVGEAAEVRIGSVVRAAERLGAVVPPGRPRVVAHFPAAAVERIHPGQPARIRLEGFPWTQYGTFAATVADVGNEPSEGLDPRRAHPGPRAAVADPPGTRSAGIGRGRGRADFPGRPGPPRGRAVPRRSAGRRRPRSVRASRPAMSTPHPARRRWLVPEVVQTSAMDCGPAVLKALLEGFGIPIRYDRLREACQTDVDGTSIDTLEEVAGQLGLVAEQVMIPVDHLLLAEARALPAVLVVRLPNGLTHFVLAWRKLGPVVQVMDPAVGRRWVSARGSSEEVYLHTQRVPAGVVARLGRLGGVPPAARGPPRPPRDRPGRCGADRRGGGRSRLAAPGPARRGDPARRRARPRRRAPAWVRDPAGTPLARPSGPVGSGKAAPGRSPRTSGRFSPRRRFPTMKGNTCSCGGPSWSGRRGSGRRARSDTRRDVPARWRSLSPELAAALAQPTVPAGRALLALSGRREPSGLPGPRGRARAGGGRRRLRGPVAPGHDRHRPQPSPHRAAAPGHRRVPRHSSRCCLLIELGVAEELARLGRRLELGLRVRFLEAIPRLHDRYFQSRPTSDMAERVHSLHQVRLFPRLAGQFLRAAIALGITAAAIAWSDPASGPLAIAAAILALGVPIALLPLLQGLDLRVRTHAGALSRFYLDALQGLTAVRAHAGAGRALRREHEGLLVEWARASQRLLRWVVILEGLQSFVGLRPGRLAPVPARGPRDRARRRAAARLLDPQPSGPGRGACDAGPAVPDPSQPGPATARAARRTGVRPGRGAGGWHAPGRSDRGANLAPGRRGHRVRVRDRFARPDRPSSRRSRPGSRPGSHVAIVGPSGAGKSSLVGLLLGWHRAAAGRVLVDGEPLAAARLDRLRRETAWIDPEVRLWNRSLLENLLYGTHPADPDRAGGRARRGRPVGGPRGISPTGSRPPSARAAAGSPGAKGNASGSGGRCSGRGCASSSSTSRSADSTGRSAASGCAGPGSSGATPPCCASLTTSRRRATSTACW